MAPAALREWRELGRDSLVEPFPEALPWLLSACLPSSSSMLTLDESWSKEFVPFLEPDFRSSAPLLLPPMAESRWLDLRTGRSSWEVSVMDISCLEEAVSTSWTVLTEECPSRSAGCSRCFSPPFLRSLPPPLSFPFLLLSLSSSLSSPGTKSAGDSSGWYAGKSSCKHVKRRHQVKCYLHTTFSLYPCKNDIKYAW